MAHFDANFHAMVVGTSNCPTVNIKVLQEQCKLRPMESLEMKKLKNSNFFRQIFVNLPLVLDP